MQGEEQPIAADATPAVLDYAPPPQRGQIISSVLWGVLFSAIYFCSLVIVFQALNDGASWCRPLWLILNLPALLLDQLLSLFGKAGLPRRMAFWIMTAESLLYGFAIALIIHWLKHRRVRRP